MKVRELTGALLDLWVARAAGEERATPPVDFGVFWLKHGKYGGVKECPRYSSDWAHGGLIIDRERITTNAWRDGSGQWTADVERVAGPIVAFSGPTALVAAMRAYVGSKFGNEVPDGDLPKAAEEPESC